MEVVESKKWAVGLSGQDFKREYVRRFPSADSIPDPAKFIYESDPKYNGIDRFVLTGENDITVEAEKVAKEEKKKDAVCAGCGKTYTHPSSKHANLNRHQKYCKTYLALRR